jgi:hypothetical protein
MVRILRRGGRLILVDHMGGSSQVVRAVAQRLVELRACHWQVSIRGRPLLLVETLGLPWER